MNPVVFVHGFMGGSRQWQGQIDSDAGYEVISLDLPGYGENAQSEALDSIASYAEWALDELSARGVERFNLVGHSMGGMVAQEMVVQTPDRVDRLVLYGTGATGVLPGRFETICTSKRRALADGPQTTARRIAATWFLEREEAPGYEACAAIAEQCRLQAMLNGLDAMENWSGVERLEDIKAKTLVIWGDRDRTYPWCQTEQLWKSISNANLSVLPGCAHAAHLEKPELFNKILGDFFSA
ncbi:alpha/beta hydrolase [Aliiroseovarius sp. M344]|uniref:alpha/beta fold hydrolase n=1 Tax=Aliiroseovarius sp. M344 TaxID=2867010 RepID=UPI0021AE2318|nr:alpha/beta hydrolase [Aliiroseovarius sp. M344]UWQ13568.1 alpha/beta hydrolase [Aliiroseovarius sp. M344]